MLMKKTNKYMYIVNNIIVCVDIYIYIYIFDPHIYADSVISIHQKRQHSEVLISSTPAYKI